MNKNCRHLVRIFCLLLLGLVWGALAGCQSAPYLRERGIEAFQIGQFGRAAQRFRDAAKTEPSHWASHYYLGMIHLKRDRPLDAQLALELALSLRPADPKTPQILDALAEAHYVQSDHAGLHGLLSKACEDFGTSHDFLRQGKYLALLGDADNAHIAFQKAVRFASSEVAPYLAMADFYVSIGANDKATTALCRALDIEPDNQLVHQGLRQLGVVPGPTIALPAVVD